MNIIIVGLSHNTAPIEIREKLFFSSQELKTSLEKLIALPEICEGIILSTCNRVEILFSSSETKTATREITKFWADHHKMSLEETTPYLYFYTDQEAVSHLFRVASSLDSMVIGEPQILGQLKEAYRSAVKTRTTGSILNRLLHKAFFVAKRVRTETEIATTAVSVSFAVVELARKIFDKIDDKKILLIGAGKMAELATYYLVANGAHDLFIANRTSEKADNLVKRFGGKAVNIDDISLYLPMVDIIICSTAASNFIINREQTAKALKLRKNRPIFMFDTAVPRNIDPAVNTLSNVYLYDIDSLKGIVDENKGLREKEALRANEIIEKETSIFLKWLEQQKITPAIIELKEKLERIRRQELNKTLSRWKGIGDEEKEKLDALTEAIVSKILHDPINYLKREQAKNALSFEEVKKLFKLNGNYSDMSDYQAQGTRGIKNRKK
ncbi:MAG: glutamyl-tRNA reductase [Proteobacteria bacterium]|nr:glutamyl-tRNA reductase [Pseudomonadota bacterium]